MLIHYIAGGQKNSVRAVFNFDNVPEDIREDRSASIQWILEAPEDVVVPLAEVEMTEPERPLTRDSFKCPIRKEWTMESRARDIRDQKVCIPCAQKMNS